MHARMMVWTDLPSFLDRLYELSTIEALELQRTLSQDAATLPEPVARQQRQSLHHKLRRITPGSTAYIAALEDPDHALLTSDDTIAAELARHWGNSLSARVGLDSSLRDAWLASEDVPKVGEGVPSTL